MMVVGVVLASLVVASGAMEDRLAQSLPVIFEKATAHYRALESAATAQMKAGNGELRVPRGFDRKTGRLDMRSVLEWTAGHFAGSLWYLYEATGESHLRDRAVVWTELLEPNKTVDTNHDVGFVINCSYGNARRLLKTDRYDAILETAARTLATRFHAGLGLIRSWGAKDDPARFLVIPDNLMNLELLEEVSVLRKDAKLGEIAVSHADVTMRHHFKPDGGCYHVLDYDQKTGRVKGVERGQGSGIESTWSRGHSWTIYGYSMMYRMTGSRRYLDQAVRCANFAMNHPNMPADGVPYWDFGNPGEERDSSAAAVMASALLELSTFLPPAEGRRYFDFAVRQLTSLAGPDYFAAPGENGDWLLKHGVGFKPAGTEIDTPLVYGDYYFLEALLRFRKIVAERGSCARREEDIPMSGRLESHRVAYAFAEPVVEAEVEFIFL